MPAPPPNPATPSALHEILRRFGLRPRRAFSQNFLIDPRVAGRIATAVGAGPDDRVVEIGAGLGAITLPLARLAGQVIAIERDPRLAQALGWVLAQHGLTVQRRVVVVVADVLRLPLDPLLSLPRGAPGRAFLAGNLPYGITSHLLLLLAASSGWQRGVVMVQEEVADRLTAAPGSEAYGSLTVALRARCRIGRLFEVSRRSFFPAPDVDSAVLEIAPLATRPGPEESRALEEVLRAAFGQRRKRLKNALRTLRARSPRGRGGDGELNADEVEALLAAAGVDGSLRAEALGVEDFLRLAAAWRRHRAATR